MRDAVSPFDLWWEGWRTAVKVGETILAAHEVVAKRLPTIVGAMRDPVAADHVELARMVSEKTAAFAQAGSALITDAMSVQTDMGKAAVHLGSLFTTGSLPTPAKMMLIHSGIHSASSKMVRSQGRTLDPIHRRVTGNAKRLRKRR